MSRLSQRCRCFADAGVVTGDSHVYVGGLASATTLQHLRLCNRCWTKKKPISAAGVNECLIYEDFFEHAERVFYACDVEIIGLQKDSWSRRSFLVSCVNTGSTDMQGPEGWSDDSQPPTHRQRLGGAAAFDCCLRVITVSAMYASIELCTYTSSSTVSRIHV